VISKIECLYLIIIIINDHIIRVGISNRISASNFTVSTAGISVLAFSKKKVDSLSEIFTVFIGWWGLTYWHIRFDAFKEEG
jgi:hypothetical protein